MMTPIGFLSSLLLFATTSTVDCQRMRATYNPKYDDSVNDRYLTREIRIKQGLLQGTVVEPSKHADLPRVDRFLGLPYAAAPVGPLRFMPPGTPPHWYTTEVYDTMPPVCPQNLPVINKSAMSFGRYKYMQKLIPFLAKQSEDCLYLNIYAPSYEQHDSARQYPVIVFIHGESFEWNSGNPYDGSVLAAYGRVVVVTFNFRLGILGFMKPGIAENTPSNFGLLDQIAALQWVQDNIAAFGGNPGSVTLMGHGTGAACVNLLMVSPVSRGADQGLFHRAILMSGTALADWAMVSNPIPFTTQVADGLNCSPPMENYGEMTNCLRGKRLDEIMSLKITGPRFMTRFGPVVDGAVVPNDPHHIMSGYKDLFSRYDLLYGVTELESYHLLDAVSLVAGMLEKDFETMLRTYLAARFENSHEFAYVKTLGLYTDIRNEGARTTGEDHRDAILDILSDARVVAPLVQTANFHSVANPKSYFYVFGHNSAYGDHARIEKSVHGEELAFVFGVPLGGPKYHFTDSANKDEVLLSEQIMTFWTNFAKTGNPNAPKKFEYFSSRSMNRRHKDIDWLEYELENRTYMNLGIPPMVGHGYRDVEMNFWNDRLPTELKIAITEKIKSFTTNQPPPWTYHTTQKVTSHEPTYRILTTYRNRPSVVFPQPTASYVIPNDGLFKTKSPEVPTPPPEVQSNVTMNIVIALGVVFLLINVLAFAGLYYKRDRLKAKERVLKRKYDDTQVVEEPTDEENKRTKVESVHDIKGCNVIRMMKSSTRSEDTYEAVKVDEKESQSSSKVTPKCKLTRQISTSTIDPHTKVRDWITHEIVQRCSPRFLRKTRQQLALEHKINQQKDGDQKPKKENRFFAGSKSKSNDIESSDQCPTRPVSPIYNTDSGNQSMKTASTQQSKTTGIPVNKTGAVKKPKKVSVAIDATPAARSSSILKQEPIEITKSLDYGYVTRDNLIDSIRPDEEPMSKSANDIDFRFGASDGEQPESTIIKIEHAHSKSDPVDGSTHKGAKPGLYAYSSPQVPLKLQTFTNPKPVDVNVTSRDESEPKCKELSAEEALQTIKRRNFPKVLPDFPESCQNYQNGAQKRRSLPPPSNLLFQSFDESTVSQSTTPVGHKIYTKIPPAPPPRTCSTLGRRPSNSSSIESPTLNVKPPEFPEAQISNTLHVGPILPKKTPSLRKPAVHVPVEYKEQPLYDNVQGATTTDPKYAPKTIVSASTNQPIRKLEPRVIIKPTLTKKTSDPKQNKHIPRVKASDTDSGMSEEYIKSNSLPRQKQEFGPNAEQERRCSETLGCNKRVQRQDSIDVGDVESTEPSCRVDQRSRIPKVSFIPTIGKAKSDKSSGSSSNSTTESSNSDTGTVKRID